MTNAADILITKPGRALRGEIEVPGDKSISHRAVMFGSLAKGTTGIRRFLPGEDCLSTVSCFRKLGIHIEMPGPTEVLVHGKGLNGLSEPKDILDVGNSGTTVRLMTGILSGQPFFSAITGDESIRRRPMGRVTKPLLEMGAAISGREKATKAPLAINGRNEPLRAINYISPVASAQVKSAVLLAGLFAGGRTRVTEPIVSRDHTERMLAAFGANVHTLDGGLISEVDGYPELHGMDIEVPGDISSAAFFLVAASIIPDSEVTIRNVGVNATRDGVLEVLQAMGANLHVENRRLMAGEPVADITVKGASLRGTEITGTIIPRLIDEIPIIAIAGLFAQGMTEIRDASELRVKETDRIATLAAELRKLGAKVEELPDGMIIQGSQFLQGTRVESHGDHRIAMSLAVAGLLAKGETSVHGANSIDVSFPGFASTLEKLRQ